MIKLNCWEFKKCGREPGGVKADELGVCPVVNEKKVDGLHGGINGGRVCWVITGTLCGGEVQGEYAKKIENCTSCEFYQEVRKEEDINFLHVLEVFKKLK